jgi:hypothetical protein
MRGPTHTGHTVLASDVSEMRAQRRFPNPGLALDHCNRRGTAPHDTEQID